MRMRGRQTGLDKDGEDVEATLTPSCASRASLAMRVGMRASRELRQRLPVETPITPPFVLALASRQTHDSLRWLGKHQRDV